MTRKSAKILLIILFLGVSFLSGIDYALADNYHDVKSFFTDSDYAADGKTGVSATLRHVADKAYFYIEDEYWKSLSGTQQNDYIRMIEKIAVEFDGNIYPKISGFYGKPWEPGIDNDPKITFLMVPLKNGFGGYFSSINEYKREEAKNSNEREMVYISAPHIIDRGVGFDRLRTFFAHEFTHLIIFSQKDRIKNVSNDVWLHEMLAEHSLDVLGYNSVYPGSSLEQRANVFLSSFSDPLCEWENKAKDYSVVTMLGQYFKDRLLDQVFPETLKNNTTGIVSVDSALTTLNVKDGFSDIFMDFAIANYINDASLEGGEYGYKNPDLKNIKLSPNFSALLGPKSRVVQLLSIKDWSIKYYKFDGSAGAVKVTMDKASASDVIEVGIILENMDGTKTIQKINLAEDITEIYLSGLGSAIKNFVIIPIAENKTTKFTDNDPSYLLSLSVESVDSAIPTISSLSSGYGFAEGGSVINIRGDHFELGTKVYFGDMEAAINKITANNIEVIAPAGNGETILKVLNPGRKESNAKIFNYFDKQPEGSLVRAAGDDEVFIIKGEYKRHIKDAKIFSFYGHLGFDKVMNISPEELSLYKESNLIISENNPKVYELENITKHWLNITAEQFSSSGRNWDAIYLINQKEFNFYQNGVEISRGF